MQTMNEMARKYMNILGAPETMGLPQFRVLHRPGARWLARCRHRVIACTCIIEVQRHMTQNPATLEQLIAHEVVHHVLNMRHGRMAVYIGHGTLFLQAAAVVNAVMGPDYVTAKNDADNSKLDHGKLPRPVMLMLYKRPGYAPVVSWFSTATDKVRRVLAALSTREGHEVRLVRTDDGRWVNGIPKTGSCRYAVPAGDMAARVDALWNEAQIVKL